MRSGPGKQCGGDRGLWKSSTPGVYTKNFYLLFIFLLPTPIPDLEPSQLLKLPAAWFLTLGPRRHAGGR